MHSKHFPKLPEVSIRKVLTDLSVNDYKVEFEVTKAVESTTFDEFKVDHVHSDVYSREHKDKLPKKENQFHGKHEIKVLDELFHTKDATGSEWKWNNINMVSQLPHIKKNSKHTSDNKKEVEYRQDSKIAPQNYSPPTPSTVSTEAINNIFKQSVMNNSGLSLDTEEYDMNQLDIQTSPSILFNDMETVLRPQVATIDEEGTDPEQIMESLLLLEFLNKANRQKGRQSIGQRQEDNKHEPLNRADQMVLDDHKPRTINGNDIKFEVPLAGANELDWSDADAFDDNNPDRNKEVSPRLFMGNSSLRKNDIFEEEDEYQIVQDGSLVFGDVTPSDMRRDLGRPHMKFKSYRWHPKRSQGDLLLESSK